ncbi:hypothetical protein [Streptomyces cacaoi]|uniref:hypothetical protein n=1 Tax=Streptomyces cacaoi TaxID=1898 RepID=UPI0026328BF5|nr:hypothetical protein [Streptomyces cacaoi]
MIGPPHEEPDFPDTTSGHEQQALDAVQTVMQWYAARLGQERRATTPDEHRIEELKAGWLQAARDRRRLEEASPQEAQYIGARYAARARELNES